MDRRRTTLRIYGIVQGVTYRESARLEAERLGLTGWVRNRSDGTVEAVAEGPAAVLEEFVRWCRRGPRHAEVTRVEQTFDEARGEFNAFRVERTQ